MAAAARLPEVRLSASAAGSGYVATEASGATRTETPLREVPQSVRVVTSELIDDLGATRLADTVDYVSGIASLNDFGGTWDNYAIRGFSSTDMGYLVNGFPGSGGYNPMRDAATVERFEFLKGPAAALYDSSNLAAPSISSRRNRSSPAPRQRNSAPGRLASHAPRSTPPARSTTRRHIA